MIKSISVLIALCTLVYIWSCFQCKLFDTDQNAEKVVKSEGLDSVEKTSNNNARSDINRDEEKQFYEKDFVSESQIKKYETFVKLVGSYIQRYVSLFLITSNLRDYIVKDPSEMIMIDLEISLSGEDLAYLQEFSKTVKDTSHYKNLSKLDAIFSKIARLKQRTLLENSVKSFKSFFSNLNIFSLFNTTNFYNFYPYLTILLCSCSIYYLILRNFSLSALFFSSVLVLESVSSYYKKLKEKETEIYVEMLKFQEIPENCYPDKSKWYHGILNYFTTDACLKYYKNLDKIPAEDVSMLESIIHNFEFYIVGYTARFFGTFFRELSDGILASMPRWTQYFLKVPVSIIIIIVIVAGFFIIFCGKRFKLSFLGASVEIGETKSVPEAVKPSIEASVGNCEIRKLKPWTKNKFPKRLTGNMGMRKKLHLKPYKSQGEILWPISKAGASELIASGDFDKNLFDTE